MKKLGLIDKHLLKIEQEKHDLEFLREVEIKRMSEKLSRTELSRICGISDELYKNTVLMRRKLSREIYRKLDLYLNWNRSRVYEEVYKSRNEVPVRKNIFGITKNMVKDAREEIYFK